MITLLIHDPQQPQSLDQSSFAGLPVQSIDESLKWPVCQTCAGQMQYQGKLKTELGLALLFICPNDPGMCDEWDANSGGNKVVIVTGNHLEPLHPIDKEVALRDAAEYSVSPVKTAYTDYEVARSSWSGGQRQVLGQLYGAPSWLQHDETPSCDRCQQPMRFVAQLEEGPAYQTQMNFGGGGVGYLFDCATDRTAKFLWQS